MARSWINKGRAQGFTLVELVLVIVITGIVSVGVTSFISYSTKIYLNVSGISEVINTSRYAMERLTRDVRSALPNSIRVSSGSASGEAFDRWQCLEFLPIEFATRYLEIPLWDKGDEATAMAPWQEIKDWQNPTQKNLKAVVYPIRTQDIYRQQQINSYWHLIKKLEVNKREDKSDLLEIEFSKDVRFSATSPQKRLFFVTQPVSYCFLGLSNSTKAELRRYANYGYLENQPSPSSLAMQNKGILMAENINNDLINDLPIEWIGNGQVSFTPEFKLLDQSFVYQQQVQVINVP